MYNVIKFKGDENSYKFCADLHWGQSCEKWSEPLWAKRGFKSKEEHSAGVISDWNNSTTNQDTVFHLGDFVFQDPKAEGFWQLCNELKYKDLWLLVGNHNSGQKNGYFAVLEEQYGKDFIDRRQEIYPLNCQIDTNKQIHFLPSYAEIIINKTPIVLSHFPLAVHNYQKEKSLMLCGHSHSSYPLTNKNTGQGYRLDVGYDSFHRTISLTEIKEILYKRNDLNILDHHIYSPN